MLSFFNLKHSSLIGLDIQTDEVCLTHVKQTKGGWRLENLARATLSAGVIIDGKISQFETLLSVIASLVCELRIKGYPTAIALPGQCVISRDIVLPLSFEDEECEAEIHAHLDHYLPGVTHDVCFDYYIERKDSHSQYGVLLAAKEEMVREYVNVVNQSGLRAKIVDIDWHALIRAIELCSTRLDETLCLLDIRYASIQFLIIQNKKLIFNEEIPLNCHAENFLDQILQHVHHCQQKWLALYRHVPIEKLYVIGEASYLAKISGYLKNHLDITIEIPEVMSHFQVSSKIKNLHYSLVGIGLAIRSRQLW